MRVRCVISSALVEGEVQAWDPTCHAIALPSFRYLLCSWHFHRWWCDVQWFSTEGSLHFCISRGHKPQQQATVSPAMLSDAHVCAAFAVCSLRHTLSSSPCITPHPPAALLGGLVWYTMLSTPTAEAASNACSVQVL